MLLCGFESRLGLESLGFSIHVAFSEAHHQVFFLGTLVSTPPSLVNGSANMIMLK